MKILCISIISLILNVLSALATEWRSIPDSNSAYCFQMYLCDRFENDTVSIKINECNIMYRQVISTNMNGFAKFIGVFASDSIQIDTLLKKTNCIMEKENLVHIEITVNSKIYTYNLDTKNGVYFCFSHHKYKEGIYYFQSKKEIYFE